MEHALQFHILCPISFFQYLDIRLFRNLQDWAETATIRVRVGVRVEHIAGRD